MHLLAAKPGGISDGSEAVDLGQTPGDIVILSAADTDLQMLAAACQSRVGPSLRLANLMNLGHNMSVDLYVDEIVSQAKLVVIRLLGGMNYWPYGIEQIAACCRALDIKLAVLPGDDQPDAELAGLSTLPAEACHRLWQYFVHGGPGNAENLLMHAADLLGGDIEWREPAPLLRAGIYWPDEDAIDCADLTTHW